MEPPKEPAKNRRAVRRRSAKRSVRVNCTANAIGLGPNIALSLLDVSEAGARVVVKEPLKPRQEVEVTFCGIGHRKPVRVVADVVWCVPAGPGTYLIGLRLQRYLTYQDLHELGSWGASGPAKPHCS
jgi:hypothetical protein